MRVIFDTVDVGEDEWLGDQPDADLGSISLEIDRERGGAATFRRRSRRPPTRAPVSESMAPAVSTPPLVVAEPRRSRLPFVLLVVALGLLFGAVVSILTLSLVTAAVLLT